MSNTTTDKPDPKAIINQINSIFPGYSFGTADYHESEQYLDLIFTDPSGTKKKKIRFKLVELDKIGVIE